ncbi:MAG: hypothetical protein ABNH00_10395 [Dokdonia sp.]|jgi:hypothetical protein
MAILKMQCQTHHSFSNVEYTNAPSDLKKMSQDASAHRTSTGNACVIDVYEETLNATASSPENREVLFTLYPETTSN